MTLNAKEAPNGGRTIEPMEPGAYPARLLGVASLGLHPQSFNGETKEPREELALTHEFLDEYLKDEDGNDIEDKPRVLTESFALHNLAADRAKSTQRYRAIDPTDEKDGDWTKLIGTPEMITVVVAAGKGKNKGKVYNNVASVSAMRAKEAAKARDLVNEPVIFDFDAPDIKAWNKLPKFLQDKARKALNFGGSALEELLANAPVEKKNEPKEAVEDADESEAEGDNKNW